MDASLAVGLLFIVLVVVLPFLLAVISGYEAPASFGESVQRCVQGTLTGCIMMAGLNFGRVGADYDQWYWEMLLVIPVMAGLQLSIDYLAMRRQAKRTTI
ncbi:MAG: hypothetical protein B7Y97_12640 [Sphingomonas sp. 32-66-10]|nr:MAG: hypothetical protein B7Y97_12640 [Sphingomonas sp. 32-66-10]